MAQRCESIDDFSVKVKELYESDPAKVRFVLKYKHAEGTMTLRATNDELVRFHALRLERCALGPRPADASAGPRRDPRPLL